MRLAQAGEIGPLWIVAREQIGGRGRHGRVWRSPPGNLYASLLLIAPCAPDVAPQLGFVAGVALVDAIVDLQLQNHESIRLKWPNDVLHDGAKLSGILVEATRVPDGALACVIGIGVNCGSHPSDHAYPVTHLSEIAGRDVPPDELLLALDRTIMAWLARWNAGADFAAVREAWLSRAAGRGAAVEVALHDRHVHGTFETIDAQGRLVVITSDGRFAVDAGDVTFAHSRSAGAFA